MRYRLVIILGYCLIAGSALASASKGGSLGVRTNDGRKHFTLSLDQVWHLDLPRNQRFDASGLAFWKGKLLTVNDRNSELYEIVLGTNKTAQLLLTPLFSRAAVAKAAAKREPRYDAEGIAVDENGAIYISEESQRAVFKTTEGAKIERLAIDWSPVKQFFGKDPNASFEGIAISPAKLFLANERDPARLIVVDRGTLRVQDSFFVDSEMFAFGGPHYSDLCYWRDRLFVLDRNHRTIFEVDPATKRVLAEYSFGQAELTPELAYRTAYPTGTMEGLTVDEKFFWLVTDNNGQGRIKFPKDSRPTLFRCSRPKE